MWSVGSSLLWLALNRRDLTVSPGRQCQNWVKMSDIQLVTQRMACCGGKPPHTFGDCLLSEVKSCVRSKRTPRRENCFSNTGEGNFSLSCLISYSPVWKVFHSSHNGPFNFSNTPGAVSTSHWAPSCQLYNFIFTNTEYPSFLLYFLCPGTCPYLTHSIFSLVVSPTRT